MWATSIDLTIIVTISACSNELQLFFCLVQHHVRFRFQALWCDFPILTLRHLAVGICCGVIGCFVKQLAVQALKRFWTSSFEPRLGLTIARNILLFWCSFRFKVSVSEIAPVSRIQLKTLTTVDRQIAAGVASAEAECECQKAHSYLVNRRVHDRSRRI